MPKSAQLGVWTQWPFHCVPLMGNATSLISVFLSAKGTQQHLPLEITVGEDVWFSLHILWFPQMEVIFICISEEMLA